MASSLDDEAIAMNASEYFYLRRMDRGSTLAILACRDPPSPRKFGGASEIDVSELKQGLTSSSTRAEPRSHYGLQAAIL
jgi:hypothetical protein